MCIVIDTNTLHLVFKKNTSQHIDFKPILSWIVYGKGKVVFGGTKYNVQLRRARSYLGVFAELDRAGKAVKLDDNHVDKIQHCIDQELPDCNDTHLMAIIIVSKCKLLCTCDRTAIPNIKNPSYYPSDIKPPKIYCQSRNQNLLNDHNIAEICKPCVKGTKQLRMYFNIN